MQQKLLHPYDMYDLLNEHPALLRLSRQDGRVVYEGVEYITSLQVPPSENCTAFKLYPELKSYIEEKNGKFLDWLG